MKPREIDVHIEELVLHGFKPANRWLIAGALKHELRGLLTTKGVPSLWLSSPERKGGGRINCASLTRPERAGAEIAGAAYRGDVK